ncbi:MAG: flavodoxin family protein, partial [Deferrisomatales bacterium]
MGSQALSEMAPGGISGRSPRLLLLHGSPRAGGNTDTLLAALAEGAGEAGARVEHLYARKLDVRGCTGCGGCAETGECVVRDDMDQVYAAVDEADALAVGAPVYFLGPPAQLKVLIDRFQPRWARRYLLHRPLPPSRPGVFLSTAGAPTPKVFTGPRHTMDALFDILGVVSRPPFKAWPEGKPSPREVTCK